MSQSAGSPVRERPRKSLGIAIALAFFFGPLGLSYASLAGAAVMLLVSAAVLVPILLGVHINAAIYLPVWIICIVWAAVAAHERTSASPPAAQGGEWKQEAPPGGGGAPGRS